MADSPHLILASSSPYRRELLERLQLPFSCVSPEVDEAPVAGEQPLDLVRRLSRLKATTVAGDCTRPALVIGSDQAACLDDTILGKPGTAHRAREQLRQLRGRQVAFLTGICLVRTADGMEQTDIVCVDVKFRNYSDTAIERYIERDQPLNCAGAFRSEALGISLVEAMHCNDPTAIIGLPLIRLCEMLRSAGVDIP
jgi:septum formation protein